MFIFIYCTGTVFFILAMDTDAPASPKIQKFGEEPPVENQTPERLSIIEQQVEKQVL